MLQKQSITLPFLPSSPKQVYKLHNPSLFQSFCSQLIHHNPDSQISEIRISYSLIELQRIPYTPACSHKFHALVVHPGPPRSNSPCLLILLIHTNTKTVIWNLGLTPRPYYVEGELIHCVDKAKIVWLIVGQLPMKARWWDTLFALQNLSRVINLIHTKQKNKMKSWTYPTS